MSEAIQLDNVRITKALEQRAQRKLGSDEVANIEGLCTVDSKNLYFNEGSEGLTTKALNNLQGNYELTAFDVCNLFRLEGLADELTAL